MLASVLAVLGLLTPPAQAQGSAQFVFQGAGWGHGVGMSQNGARNAANGGMDHVGILNFYYPNTVIGTVSPIQDIRVHIGDASLVEMSSEGPLVFERGGVAINSIASGSITVTAHDGGLQVGNAWTTGSANDPLIVSFPQPVKISNNGHRYLWGKIQLTNKNGKVRVVEVLPMEKYVAGISEMPAAWPLEALMAQAIAARTYAHEVTMHRRNSTEWAQEYDISGTTVDQNYIGYDAQDSAWDQKWLAAVSATADVQIIDANGPIRAYYSASNGGYTETADYVFSNPVPYTVSGPDPYDEGGHDWTTWTRTYSQQSISRWLNAHADTSVGTLTAINVLGGQGASARLDKAVVELVGSNGTKRVTGKRLMVVMNAGIFGEGGGLSTHLPGTFTTIGNGAAAGPPVPSGAAVLASVTPDPVAEQIDENADFTPPPGWQPEPGTGVPPTGAAETASGDAADNGTGTAEAPTGDAGYQPPAGWQPEPGTGVAPEATAAPAADNSTGAEAAGAGASEGGYQPPADWRPEPGTGVPPGEPVAPSATPDAGSAVGYQPPAGWQPEAGTGVPPGDAVAPLSAAVSQDTESSAVAGYRPPAGWQPEPGTGVVPTQASFAPTDDWRPEPGTGVAPLPSNEAQSSAAPTSTAETSAAPTSTAETSADQTSAPAATPPAVPASAPATSEAETDTQSSSALSAPTTAEQADTPTGPTLAGTSRFVPPPGWQPAPGTGIAPLVGPTMNTTPLASGVVLVKRGEQTNASETTFRVIAPTDELAEQAREQLDRLRSTGDVYANIDEYVASVAPQPVNGVCTATATGVICASVETD